MVYMYLSGDCDAGMGLDAAGSSSCVECPIGSYGPGGSLECITCASGLTTIELGSTSVDQCVGK